MKTYGFPAVHFSNDYIPCTYLILHGMKTIETRNNRRLDAYLGRRIGIIATRSHKPSMLVGFATLEREVTTFKDYDSFHLERYEELHRICKGSHYDMKDGKTKYGYHLTDVRAIDPVRLPVSTYDKNYTARDLADFIVEHGGEESFQ